MELKLNRKYKDTLFRKVFNNKKDLLSLYNALNNTEHMDDSLITITTIEDAIYIGYKNDISFIINSELNLYEHQSSVNPNMPVTVRFSSVLYEWLRNKADKEEISFNQMVLQCCKYVMDEEERNAEIKETGDLHE